MNLTVAYAIIMTMIAIFALSAWARTLSSKRRFVAEVQRVANQNAARNNGQVVRPPNVHQR